jgi:hypothetical protein
MLHTQDLDYVVERDENRWTVSFQGRHCGRFQSRRRALGSAVGDAERACRLGHRIRVSARHADGSVGVITLHPPGP